AGPREAAQQGRDERSGEPGDGLRALQQQPRRSPGPHVRARRRRVPEPRRDGRRDRAPRPRLPAPRPAPCRGPRDAGPPRFGGPRAGGAGTLTDPESSVEDPLTGEDTMQTTTTIPAKIRISQNGAYAVTGELVRHPDGTVTIEDCPAVLGPDGLDHESGEQQKAAERAYAAIEAAIARGESIVAIDGCVYTWRSEEKTSELQSRENIVCR